MLIDIITEITEQQHYREQLERKLHDHPSEDELWVIEDEIQCVNDNLTDLWEQFDNYRNLIQNETTTDTTSS